MRTLGSLAVLVLTSGCFVELRGGMVGVTGVNNSEWRAVPTFGVAAGFVFDASLTRMSVGGGTDATPITMAGQPQLAMAGPYDIRVDYRGGKFNDLKSGPRMGFALAAALPGSKGGTGRWGEGKANRAWSSATLFAGLDGWFPLGTSTVMIDMAIGAVMPIAVGQVGITDLFGIGAQGRLTISVGGTLLGHALDGLVTAVANSKGMTPEELKAFDAEQKQQGANAAKREKDQQDADKSRNEQQQGDRESYQKCVERGDEGCK